MKKQNILVIAILFMAAGLSAQSFGVRAGVNMASQSWSEDAGIDLSSRTGFYVGAIAEFGISENLFLQGELDYIQKGAKAEFLGEENEQTVSYLEVPILLKYKMGLGEMLGLHITAGPTLGYALNGTTDDEDIDFDEDGYERFELGASIGAGVGLGVAGGMLSLEVRYGLGFTNLVSDEDVDLTVTNKGLSVGLAYMF